MPIDPDELKVRRINREKQIQDIQNYIEEQDALEKESATGKMGHRDVQKGVSIGEKISNIVSLALNFFKGK